MTENKKNKVVALCTAGLDKEYQDTLMNKICRYAQDKEFKILIFTCYSELMHAEKHDIGERNIYNLINFDIIDAMIILSENFKGEDFLLELASKGIDAGIPVISIEKELDGCFNILFDYSKTMEDIVRHFITAHKFTKLNFFAGFKNNEYSEERLNAYKKVLTEYNIPIDEKRIHYGDFWAGPTYAAMDELMASGIELPEVFICANDAMAIAVCEKLEQYGLKVPDDVCVSGFDGILEEKYHTPRLTTAKQNLDAAAKLAIDKLADVFAGRDTAKIEKVSNELIISRSCGCESTRAETPNYYIRKLNEESADFYTYSTFMVRMVSDLSDGISIGQCANDLRSYLYLISFPEIWFCINDDFICDVNCVEDIFGDETPAVSGYPLRMRMLLHKSPDGNMDSCSTFTQAQILPNLSEILEKNGHLLLAPLHFQDKSIGYTAVTFELPYYGFYKFYSFIMNLSNILQTIKYNTEMHSLISRLEEMYVHDSLTGLYNRRGFYINVNDYFEKCKRELKKMVIISLDLDGLKTINDVYGHSEGDNAIKVLATALHSNSVHNEICARFGGDEYIVANIADEDAKDGSEYVSEYIRKLQNFLNDYNSSSGKPYNIQVSYGVVKQIPTDNITLDTMIKAADELMYKDKFKHKKYRDTRR